MRDGTKKARSRGRPREFDEDAALHRATRVFWSQGFAATSLDELAGAMQMKRPSIANAFGDKEALYRETLARFGEQLKRELGALLADEPDLRKALTAFYYAALDVYFASEPALGCLVMCTAPVEAVAHPEVRADLERLIRRIDELLADRFARAKADGQLRPDADARASGKLTQAVLHSLAIRARAGASRASLRKLARQAVAALTA